VMFVSFFFLSGISILTRDALYEHSLICTYRVFTRSRTYICVRCWRVCMTLIKVEIYEEILSSSKLQEPNNV
jgi:hypothetical protein